MKKMAVGGTTTKRIIKKSTGGMYGIPQENLGTSGQYGFAKKGGATKAAKFAALAPPYDKATFADKIVGAKKSAGSKALPKAQLGAIIKGIMGFKSGYKASKIVKQAAKKGNFKDWHNEMDILLKKSNPNVKKYIGKEAVIKNFKKVIKSKPGDTYKSAVNLKTISPKPKNTYKSAVNLKNASKVKVKTNKK